MCCVFIFSQSLQQYYNKHANNFCSAKLIRKAPVYLLLKTIHSILTIHTTPKMQLTGEDERLTTNSAPRRMMHPSLSSKTPALNLRPSAWIACLIGWHSGD